jgi:hypothetical protein
VTVAKAAEEFIRIKRRQKQLEAELVEPRETLLKHFRRTGAADYKGLVSYSKSVREQLDTKKVKAFLGKKVSRFLKKTDVEQLSVL